MISNLLEKCWPKLDKAIGSQHVGNAELAQNCQEEKHSFFLFSAIPLFESWAEQQTFPFEQDIW